MPATGAIISTNSSPTYNHIPAMSDFTPVNSLETKLRALINDKNTPVWSFYTPLAAARVWIFIKRYPELDGTGLLIPKGENPAVCIFHQPAQDFVGIYTAESRADEIAQKWNIPAGEYHAIATPGYQALHLLGQSDSEIWINAGLQGCQHHIDADFLEIILSRPEPEYEMTPASSIELHPEGDPQQYLRLLREFLASQPTVRAAWIFGARSTEPQLPGQPPVPGKGLTA